MYRDILDQPFEELGEIPRARAPLRMPVVLTGAVVAAVLERLTGVYRLIGILLYGGGMRLMECLRIENQGRGCGTTRGGGGVARRRRTV